MFKKLFFVFVNFLVIISFNFKGETEPASFNFYESPYLVNNDLYEQYKPKTMTALIARLPEYSLYGPGYICELRQPPMVYRYPIIYDRQLGYRETDWVNNNMIDKNLFPLNFGGYTF